MARWKNLLNRSGHEVQLVYLSVDDTDEAVTKFRETRNWLPHSLRAASIDAIAPWFESLGLPNSTAIPVHIFVDPNGKARCVRAGGIAEHHYDAVSTLLGSTTEI